MDVAISGLRYERNGRMVLDVPDLRLRAGCITALLGPNGAGKSTLLRMIAGLERPGAGSVHIDDREVSGARGVRDLVAFSFQEPVFLGGSVRENLALGLRLRNIPREEHESRVEAAARALGIAGLLGRNAHELSGGEAQRANLARTLALRAPVTLLDEPLSGLDGPSQRQLLDELPGLLAEFAPTTIFVTHVREEAMRLANDLVVLIDGRVRAAGPKAGVLRNPPDEDAARFLGYVILSDGGNRIPVPPWQLLPGDGVYRFELVVREVLDTGFGWEVAGRIGEESVRLPWAGSPPALGDVVVVSWQGHG